MTYSQLSLRLTATAIFIGATYLLATDQLCLPAKSGVCRPVHGIATFILYLATASFASVFLVAATAPRRGARLKELMIAVAAFAVLLMSAFLMALFKL